jgi:hypothetical protein
LLIVNTDRDPIFPLDGVVRLHSLVRNVYRSYNAETNLGLVISEGGHKDTQDIQVPVMRWFNRYLKGEDPLIERAAVKLLQPEELKVFATLPQTRSTQTSTKHLCHWPKFRPTFQLVNTPNFLMSCAPNASPVGLNEHTRPSRKD